MNSILKQEKWFLLGLFFCALALRLVYFETFLRDNPCVLMFDSGQYHELATEITQGHGFAKPDGSPQFYRLPGYSLFLALCYKIFNFLKLSNIIQATLLVQIILASCIPVLIFLLALRMFPHDRRAAKIAGIIACIHHGFLIFSGLIMSESLFIIFFLLFLLMLFRLPVTTPIMLCAGLLLGCVSMIRSVGFALLIVSFLVIAMTVRPAYRAMIMLFIGWLLVIGIWLARNYMLTGYIFLDTLSGAHLLNHQAVPVLMKAEQIPHAQAKNKVYALFEEQKRAREKKLQRPLYDIELCHIAHQITKKLGKKYQYATLKHNFFNIFKTCFSLYASELLVIDSAGSLPDYDNNRTLGSMLKRYLMPDVSNTFIVYAIFFEIVLFLVILIGFFGVFTMIHDDSFVNFLNNFCMRMLPFMIVLLGISFACGFARLRLPLSPFFIIVSSRFWSLMAKKMIKKNDEEKRVTRD